MILKKSNASEAANEHGHTIQTPSEKTMRDKRSLAQKRKHAGILFRSIKLLSLKLLNLRQRGS